MTMPGRTDGQDGFILVVVIWVIASLSLLMMAFNASVRTNVALNASENDQARQRWHSEGAIELAIERLLLPAEDERAWRADGTAYQIDFAGALLYVRIYDTNGRIDINKAAEPLLTGLLRQFAASPAQADQIRDRILDWRDADEERLPVGAEDADYRQAGLAYGAADGPFADLFQLGDVLGMPSGMAARLRPFMTLHSRNGRINPLTAPPEVLLAIPEMSISDIEDIQQNRALRRDISDILVLLPPAATRWLSPVAGPAYDVLVSVRSPDGTEKPLRQVTVLPKADEAAPYRVIDWRQGDMATRDIKDRE